MEQEQEEYFQKEFLARKQHLEEHLEHTRRVIAVNEYLKKFNWAFVHPFLLGGQIKYFEDLEKDNNTDKSKISNLFYQGFFNLNYTVSYLQNFIETSKSLSPFCKLINQSVFLCIQEDYAGAIHLLIPVIEGSMRNYIKNRNQNPEDKFSTISSTTIQLVFQRILEDYLSRMRDAYNSGLFNYGGKRRSFNDEQIEELLKIDKETFEIWLRIIFDYFKKNLYLDTRHRDFQDALNRHSMLHGFLTDVYQYSVENYLKIFNAVLFLSYSFHLAESTGSLFPEGNQERFRRKLLAFEKVKKYSSILVKIKSSVYEDCIKNE